MAFVEGRRAAEDDEHTEVSLLYSLLRCYDMLMAPLDGWFRNRAVQEASRSAHQGVHTGFQFKPRERTCWSGSLRTSRHGMGAVHSTRKTRRRYRPTDKGDAGDPWTGSY